MTAAVSLLQQLRAAGIDVTADADRLQLRSRTPLPHGLIELVRKHKPDLLALLAGDNRQPLRGWSQRTVRRARRGSARAVSQPLLSWMATATWPFNIRRAERFRDVVQRCTHFWDPSPHAARLTPPSSAIFHHGFPVVARAVIGFR
jgi:hypothetical protein